jgi:hypothetical protein
VCSSDLRALAAELRAAVGDDILLRVQTPTAISAETLLGRRDTAATTLRLTVAGGYYHSLGLKPAIPGDLNCDGVVDVDDINPFVLAIVDPVAYQAAYPNCNFLNGDCNGDGFVDFDDINAFVALLSGS